MAEEWAKSTKSINAKCRGFRPGWYKTAAEKSDDSDVTINTFDQVQQLSYNKQG